MKKWLILILVSISCLLSCDDELKPADESIFFDKVALLTSVANNHILPEYQQFREDVEKMVVAKNTFITAKTVENLQLFRDSYLKSYISFQAVAKYGFGLAGENNFYQNLNSHPLNLNDIEGFILNQENANLSSVLTQDRQGFPALDYLLNGLAGDDTMMVAFYTGDNGTDYTEFLSKVTNRIDQLSKEVTDDWEGNFKQTFSRDAGFLDVFVNGYIQYFETRLRSSKVDFPAGKFDGTPSPETIESVFRPQESRTLLLEALESSRQLYLGVNDQLSLSQVLKNLGEEGLDARIKLEFLEAQNVINTLNEDLSAQVMGDNTKMLIARDELQDIVLLLKIDLTSKLNVAITFRDNDGD